VSEDLIRAPVGRPPPLRGRRVSIIEDTHDLLTERQLIEFVSRAENVRRIEVNVEENSSRDISEDIARAMIHASIELNDSVKEFLENQLGCDVARQALHEIAA
jgi:hypothetical protein